MRPNIRVRCTNCALTLMTRLASRVVGGGVLVMMIMSTKPLLITQSIGLSCAGMPVNLHVQALLLQALPIIQKTTHVDNAAPRGSRRPQSAGTDWLITSPGGPTDTHLISSYGGHIANVIFKCSERMPPIIECRS